MWGSGLNGRLGNGAKENIDEPELSKTLKSYRIASIVMGCNSTFGILENKSVYAWGSSKSGKLGFEMAKGKNYELPKQVISLNNKLTGE